ncbi:MAG: HD domain-containing phosphohydrolase [Coriobacteriia bacterium]
MQPGRQQGTGSWTALAVFGAACILVGFLIPSEVLALAGAGASILGLWQLRVASRETIEPMPVAAVPAAAAPIPRIPPGLEPEVVLCALRDSVTHVATPVAAHLWLADEPTGTLRRVAAVGPMAPSPQPVLLSEDDVLVRACTGGTAELGPVARIRGGAEPSTIWRYALPVSAGDTRGVAAVDFQSETQVDASTLPEVTAPLRGSLTGALGLHVARQELETAQMLIAAARDLSRMLDPREVLSTALRRAMELSDAQTGSIMLLDPATGRLAIEIAEGLPAEVVQDATLAEGEGIAGWVLASRQPLLIEDLPARTPAARRHGIRSAVSVPIADDDGVLGVLNVGSRSFPARFTESHLSSIEILGKQTATALRNARAVVESRQLYFDTLKALAVALETKDPYSRGGTDRVLEYVEAMARVFGLQEDEYDAVRIAALLHDIGMSAAGEGVAVADRPLTTVERALLKMHPQVAAEILAEAPALRQVVPIVYHHHEWYDGEGYLSGLSGEDIPIGARILAVADAYVAMTSDRPYRAAFTSAEALRELVDKAGTQFDPAAVEVLRDILQSGSSRVPGSSDGRA